MPSSENKRQRAKQAIAVLETQRALLGDDVVDSAVAALRSQLVESRLVSSFQQERKLVTVLFMDIVGSTSIVRDLDPEDTIAIMDTALMKLTAPVSAHGGRTTRYMGDGFKAVFGVPTARENDPEMAVRAGLAIISVAETYARELERKWGVNGFAVRVGISTGLVMVGGDSEAADTIMGATVNQAARLESAAAPGTVLISHDTYQHVRGLFELQSVDPINAKGFRDPLAAYNVLRAKAQMFQVLSRGVLGKRTAMIGRVNDLVRLKSAFRVVSDNQIRHIATIVGEAGVGKSRLIYEFEDWLARQPEQPRQYKGRARPETRNMPYGLLRSLLGVDFDIWGGNSAHSKWEKAAQQLLELLGEAKTHYIGQMLGYGYVDSPYLEIAKGDPKQIRDRSLRYLIEYFSKIAADGPVVIFLDDIHWADESSLDIVQQIAMAIPDLPLLILAATRPSLYARRPNWSQEQSFHERIDLHELSPRESKQLISNMLDRLETIPESLMNLVVNNAEGNPFFMEETINMLIDDEVIITSATQQWELDVAKLDTKNIPPTLVGVLQARLERLEPEYEQGIRQAAVIGRLFWKDIVLQMNQAGFQPVLDGADIDLAMNHLQERHMIIEQRTAGPEIAPLYLFRHAVLRDVAYEKVLRRHRRVYHGLAADWLIEHKLMHEDDSVAQIANHLLHSEIPQRAYPYLLQAGKRAAAQYANNEAIGYFSQALELLRDDNPEERYEALLGRAEVYGLVGERDRQRDDLAKLDEIARESGELERRTQVALQRANLAESVGDYKEAIALAQQAVDLAEAAVKWKHAAEGNIIWGNALTRISLYDKARKRLLKALQMGQETNLGRLAAKALLDLGNIARVLADYHTGKTYYEQALTIYRSEKDLRGESSALGNLGVIAFHKADYSAARAYAEQALAIFQTIGDRQNECKALNNLGVFAGVQGDSPASVRYYGKALIIAQETLDRAMEAMLLSNLAQIAIHEEEEYETARRQLDQALAIRRKIGDKVGILHSFRLMAELWMAQENWKKARLTNREVLSLASELQMESFCMEARVNLARIAFLNGALQRARSQVDIVLEFLDTGGNLNDSHFPQRDYLTCYQVLVADQTPGAWDLIERAHSHLMDITAGLDDEKTQKVLNSTSFNKEIINLWETLSSEGNHIND